MPSPLVMCSSPALVLAFLLGACAPAGLTPGEAAPGAASPDEVADGAASPDGTGAAADGAAMLDGPADLAPPDAGADMARVPDCSDGKFVRRNEVEYTLGDRTFPVGVTFHYCLDLPVDAQRQGKTFVELNSVNLGNAQCGSLRVVVTTPSGKRLVSFGAQPGTVSPYESGRWEVQFKNQYGCDRYRISIVI